VVKSNPGLFVPLHFRSRERKVHKENFHSCGTFILWNIHSLELSFLRSERSKNFRSVEHLLPSNFRSSGANVPRTFIPMKLSFHENEYSKNFRSKCSKKRPETGYKPYSLRTLIFFIFILWGGTCSLRMPTLRPASQAGPMHNSREETSVVLRDTTRLT